MELNLNLPEQEVTGEVLIEKYAKGSETKVEHIQARVAKALAKDDKAAEARFFEVQNRYGFIPAGRINSAAGTELQATLINCFVQPIGDTMIGLDKNGFPGIMVAAADAAETMRRGGGVGYDFSRIRPTGALVKGTQSRASGPISFMRVFDKLCETVESAGARRGAQMGVLRVDHPDLLGFIAYKKTKGEGNNFNISIGVTDVFMQAVKDGGEFELCHEAEPTDELKAEGAYLRDDGKWVYRKVQAAEIFEAIMRSTYDFAEPGVLFLDTINRDNNLSYCELIEATNPCGEATLPPYGCCCLGSVNLNVFVRNAFTPEASFDMAAFIAAVPTMVEMLDQVLDETHWPLEKQKEEAMSKRRVGLGYTGLGDTLIMLGLRYDSVGGRQFATEVTIAMRDAAYRASIELAKVHGAFPLFDAEKYLAEPSFASRLPEDIKADIRKYGMRNSHLMAIAPTGTISLAFGDNASNGVEPPFSWMYTRTKRMPDGSKKDYQVEDHAYRVFRAKFGPEEMLPASFVNALQISAMDHEKMVAAVAPYVDAAVSKTVNVPADYPFEDFAGLYMAAWEDGLKGITTYRPNATLGAVLSAGPVADTSEKTPVIPDENPLRKQFEDRPSGDLEGVTSKVEYRTQEGLKTVYITVNFMSVEGVVDGKKVVIERPFEFFMPAGQNDDQQWVISNMRLLSMVARYGGDIAKAIANMRSVVWPKGLVQCGHISKTTPDGEFKVPLQHESVVAAIGYAFQRILQKRGFLDSEGMQVPLRVLAGRNADLDAEFSLEPDDTPPPEAAKPENRVMPGKPCTECGAHAVIKVAGCEKCTACGALGSCG